MYIPKAYQESNKDEITQFIKQNSFGILFSQGDSPMATHLPFLYDESIGEHGVLYGHMARPNPQWKEATGEVVVVFHGAHSYISPTWYEEENTVPTWNYVAVHAYGEFSVVEEKDELLRTLQETVDYYEASMPIPWKMDSENDYVQGLVHGIVGFKIHISRLEGKWKLNQNHPIERQEKVIAQLLQSSDENSIEIASLMEKNVRASKSIADSASNGERYKVDNSFQDFEKSGEYKDLPGKGKPLQSDSLKN